MPDFLKPVFYWDRARRPANTNYVRTEKSSHEHAWDRSGGGDSLSSIKVWHGKIPSIVISMAELGV